MSRLTLDVGEWAEENFAECDLRDVRPTRRAVTVARQMAEHPDGSTPDQAEEWSDLKAMYRLFNADEVTFTALATHTGVGAGDGIVDWRHDGNRLRHSPVG